MSLARGLGSYAAALMADGITEDLELIQAVDKLDKATPGTNSAWALCEKIRKGDAGRTEAREALRRATEPKETRTHLVPKSEQDKIPDPLADSANFRNWVHNPSPYASGALKVLFDLSEPSGRLVIRVNMGNYGGSIGLHSRDVPYQVWIFPKASQYEFDSEPQMRNLDPEQI